MVDNKEFEGDYLNGNPWNGNFKFCDKIYELKNGKGFVKDNNYFNNKLIFEGEYYCNNLNNKKNGKTGKKW